ncbi:MAG: alpha/beta hydrolase [Mycobacterium sp.]
MTLSLADIDRWSAEAIGTVFRAAIQRAHGTRIASAAIGQTMVFLDWDGDAAVAAKAATHRTMVDLNAHADACEAVGSAAEKAAGEVTAIKLRLQQIRSTARDYHLSIDDETGAVSLPADLSSFSPADRREITDAQIRVLLAVRQLLQDAHSADEDLAAAIRGADGALSAAKVRAEICDGPFAVSVPPPPDATPERVNAWWNSLNPSEQDRIKRWFPDSIRNRDGIPADVRSELNMTALAREIARFQNGWLDRNGWHTDPAKLADLMALRDTLAKQDNIGAKLLLLDTAGNPGKVLAAVAVGDVDNAERVGVTLGGMNTRVSSSVGRMVREAQVQRDKAGQLRNDAGLPNADAVASVAYLGYDAPSNVHDVIHDNLAHAGARPLNGFYKGLAATTNVADQHITGFGHSYGSLTTSLALQLGAPVDDVVLYGSPGAEITDAAQLGVKPGHAYYMIGAHDFVADTIPIAHDFGPGLFDIPGMTELSVDSGIAPDGKLHEQSHGHSEYPRMGSNEELRMSGYNMAAVLAGLPDKIVRPRSLAPGPIFGPSESSPPGRQRTA